MQRRKKNVLQQREAITENRVTVKKKKKRKKKKYTARRILSENKDMKTDSVVGNNLGNWRLPFFSALKERKQGSTMREMRTPKRGRKY